ncbi:MAG: sugar phosphate nucleotidyltransferase [bacterium]|nr:sugar phosphate nucleotidyltransferase [bacterium]
MNTYVVIMAGGSGERFWPLSRIKKPKQLLRLTSDSQTMIEQAIERITPLVPAERILIITSEVLREPLLSALPALPKENIIAEPAKRNTAPCLALAAAIIKVREGNGSANTSAKTTTSTSANTSAKTNAHTADVVSSGNDALMVVLAADHFIGDADAFRADITKALNYAEANDALVTIGIPPTRPETGYGYIQIVRAQREDKFAIHPVVQFREKPTAELAREFLASGNYLWNSGMFFWRVSTLESAMKANLPLVGGEIQAMTEIMSGKTGSSSLVVESDSDDALQKIYTQKNLMELLFNSMPDISIDFSVMERAKNVAVLPASFPWDDVGSWDALDRLQSHDSFDNVVEGVVEMIDTAGSIICNANSRPHIVATLGLDDIVIVATDDATLVCSKDRAQDVKLLVTGLRNKGRKDVL